LQSEYWGLRSMAYEIKKNKKGHYNFFRFESQSKIINKLHDNFKVSEEIIKYLTLKVNTISNKPSLMMQTPNEVGRKT
jgi:small subunit ribosomal protein S6